MTLFMQEENWEWMPAMRGNFSFDYVLPFEHVQRLGRTAPFPIERGDCDFKSVSKAFQSRLFCTFRRALLVSRPIISIVRGKLIINDLHTTWRDFNFGTSH